MAKRLMEEARDVFRTHHYSYRTEVTYIKWIKRFIKYHGKRRPRELGPTEIQSFLTDLATRGKVSASTQNQALSALLFLYKKVLRIDLRFLDEIVRAKRPVRVPIVLTQSEAIKVLGCLQGRHWLMASLLYGRGLWTPFGEYWNGTGRRVSLVSRCRTRLIASIRTPHCPGVGNISSRQRIMRLFGVTSDGAAIMRIRPVCPER